MKKTKNKFKILLLVLICTLSIPTGITSFAQSESVSGTSRAATDGATLWLVDSKTKLSPKYGEWISGVSGYGPGGTLSMSKTLSVSNTISGNYSSKADIALAMGFSIGVTYSKSFSYTSGTLKDGHWEVRYRKKYDYYKVVQRQYTRLDGKNYSTGKTQTCYVKKYVAPDFKLVKIK